MPKDALWTPAELCGHLHKFGPRTCTWRRRFFALKGANLFYFRSAGARRPLGVIPLEGAMVVAEQLQVPAVGPLAGSTSRELHTLQVALAPEHAARHRHRAYLLAAPTLELQDLWHNALVEASLPRGLLLAAAQEAVDTGTITAMQQPRGSTLTAAAAAEPLTAERHSYHVPQADPSLTAALHQEATWQEWQKRLGQSQVVGARPSVAQQLMPRASQPAAALAAAGGHLQRLSQAAAAAAAAAEVGSQPLGAQILVGVAGGVASTAAGPGVHHMRLQQLKQLAASPRRKRWSCCWGLCQMSDEEAPSTAGEGDSDGEGSRASLGGGAASAVASESTRMSQTTQQWATPSMSVAQTTKLRQSMLQRASAVSLGPMAAEGGEMGAGRGYEVGEASAGHLEPLNLRPALPHHSALARRNSSGSEERWQGSAAHPPLMVASLSGAAEVPPPSTGPHQPGPGQRGSVSDSGMGGARRSGRRPTSAARHQAMSDAMRADGVDVARAARASSAFGRPSQAQHRERRERPAADGARETAIRRSVGGDDAAAHTSAAAAAGGVDDTLSLITTFDDDVDNTAAAGWRVAPGRYMRGDSGWLDFGAPQTGRGGGDTRSASSGFLSDFGSKEGAGPGWGSTGDGDDGHHSRERPTRAGGGSGGGGADSWGARASSGGGGGSAAWGSKAAAPHRHRSARSALNAAALRQQLELQQQQLDVLTSLLVLQQQQQQQQQQQTPPHAPVAGPAVAAYSSVTAPAPAATPTPPAAPPARGVPRASAMVGRAIGVQSMVRALQHQGGERHSVREHGTSRPSDGAPSAPSPAVQPRRSMHVSSGGAASSAATLPLAPPADALAEYDAVSQELRAQFLERLRGQQQQRASLTGAAVAGDGGAVGGGFDLAAEGAEQEGGDWGEPAEEERDEGSGGGGPASGSDASSFTLGGGLPEGALVEASPQQAGSILTAVEQLRGSVAHLQHQLGLSPAEGGGPGQDGVRRSQVFPSTAAPKLAPPLRGPPPPPPPPPPVFHPAAMEARQPRPSTRAESSPPRASRAVPGTPAPDASRAQLLREVVAGAGGGLTLRHVERPSQVARAAAGRY